MTASLSFPVRPSIERKQHLSALRVTMIAYLGAKAADEDWHGVSDAANDLREIDAELRALRTGD